VIPSSGRLIDHIGDRGRYDRFEYIRLRRGLRARRNAPPDLKRTLFATLWDEELRNACR
jgi:hypothetical protein